MEEGASLCLHIYNANLCSCLLAFFTPRLGSPNYNMFSIKTMEEEFLFYNFYHNIFDPKVINKSTRENESLWIAGVPYERKISYLGYSGPLQGFFPEGKDRTSGPWSNFLFIWGRTRGETKTLVTMKVQKWEILYLKARGNLLDMNSTPFW